MQRISSINPARVAWCCQDAGLSIEQLADQTGLDPGRLASHALSEQGLTFNQLRKLADVFGRGVLFFMEPGPVRPDELRSAQFRTLTNRKPDLTPRVRALIERVERHRSLYLSLLEDAGESPPPFEPPDLPVDLRQAADAVRRWLCLAHQNDFEASRLAVEARGVLVVRSNGYSGQWQIPPDSPISGFSIYDPGCPVIFLRKLQPDSRQTFTLMHELGHLLLHRASCIDSEDDLFSAAGREREANLFAAHLLVPDRFLLEIDDARRPESAEQFDGWLNPFKAHWGVSGEVILRRLVEAGRMTGDDYAAYRRLVTRPVDQTGTRMYRHREPWHMFGRPFVRAVFSALYADRISLSRASTCLDNLKITDVRKLEQYLANV